MVDVFQGLHNLFLDASDFVFGLIGQKLDSRGCHVRKIESGSYFLHFNSKRGGIICPIMKNIFFSIWLILRL
jgi:hypothetical protein